MSPQQPSRRSTPGRGKSAGCSSILGSGFIISRVRVPGKALCVTAAHVIDDAHRALGLQRPRTGGVAPGFEVFRFDESLKEPCARGALRGYVVIDGKADFAQITEAVLVGSLDVGLVVLSSAVFDSHASAFAINSDFFDPGTPIVALGTQETRVEDRGPVEDGRMFLVEPRIEARYGRIRQVHRRDRQLKTVAYELTISIPHGMSGGPILLAPEPGLGMQAIAFASYDHAPKETVDDCNVPGAGTAIPMSAAFIAAVAGENQIPLLEHVRQSRVRDLGTAWRDIEVVRENDEIFFRRLSGLPLD